MAKKKIPNLVYICVEGDEGEEFLTVYEDLQNGLPEGIVAIFKKTEEVELRTISQIKRKGTKTWFQA